MLRVRLTSGRSDQYVTVKVHIDSEIDETYGERVVFEHLATIDTNHPGLAHLRLPTDNFLLQQQDGRRHYCTVYRPLHATAFDFQRRNGDAVPLNEALAKGILHSILLSLSFLHDEANVTHSGTVSLLCTQQKVCTC